MSSPSNPSRIQRVRVLDMLRLLAAFQMVQGHTVDAVLAPAYRQGAFHSLWQAARGLTSVAFLFVAGAAFFLASTSAKAPAVGRVSRVRRAGQLLAIGYLLHSPFFALLGGDAAQAARAIEHAVIVDVLQCIGVTVLVLEGLSRAPLRSGTRAGLALGLGALMIGASPWAAGLDPGGPFRPLLNYVSARGGSIFPLLPWAGHALIGAGLAPWLLRTDRRVTRFAVAGLGVLGVGLVLSAALGANALPAVHLTRLGAVLLVGAGLAAVEPFVQGAPSWLWALSGHTLFIYVLHVVLAYGQGIGLRSRVGLTLGPWAASLFALAMVVVSFGGAHLYDTLRARRGLAVRAAPG